MNIGYKTTDVEYATALEAGRRTAESEFRAEAVTYLVKLDAIEILVSKNFGFIIPRNMVGVLQDVDPVDLAKMEVWPDGSIIEIEQLDIHILVDGMIKAALPLLVPSRIVASLFASKGGAARSKAKASSSRENGKKGGRPKNEARIAELVA